MTQLFDRCRYEVRQLGSPAIFLPIVIVALFGGVALLMHVQDETDSRVFRSFLAGLEMGLPLAAGVMAVSITTSDPARDLQFTLLQPYRSTIALRLAIMTGWMASVALLSTVVLGSLNFWRSPQPFMQGQLSWLAPLLWFCAFGALLPLLIGSRTGATAILGGIWIFEAIAGDYFAERVWLRPFFLFMTTHQPDAPNWLQNRLMMLVTAAIVFALIPFFLERSSGSFALGSE
jgi:hypothetical protein